MNTMRKVLLGTLALAAIAGGVVAAAAHRGDWRHGPHGRHGGEFWSMGLAGPLCKGMGPEMADIMAVRLEHRLKTTDAQKSVLEELKTAFKSGAAKVEGSCPRWPERTADGKPAARPAAPERLAALEAGLAARLEAVRIVRPVAEKFYATLDETQRKKLAEMGERRRGWWAHRGSKGPGGDGPGRDSEAESEPARP